LIWLTVLIRPYIKEAAVVGLPSEKWGQQVAAAIVFEPGQEKKSKGGKPWSALDLRRAVKDQLAAFKIPQVVKIVPEQLPRNAMGKGMFRMTWLRVWLTFN
jgi:malonyl-CoA/methylmalonyl-CoA synthetase